MAKLLRKQFNIPCSGDGTFILLARVKSETGTYRYIYGVARQRDGVQIECHSADYYQDVRITVDNGIANVKVYGEKTTEETVSYRCCFIPRDPFALPFTPEPTK